MSRGTWFIPGGGRGGPQGTWNAPWIEILTPFRVHRDERGHDAGQAEDGENRKGDKWEDHGKFTPLVSMGERLNSRQP